MAELFKNRTNTKGLHMHPLLAHMPMQQPIPLAAEEGTFSLTPQSKTDYLPQNFTFERVRRLIDPSTGWKGPEYWQQHALQMSMMEDCITAVELTGWDGEKLWRLLCQKLPVPGESPTEEQGLAQRVVQESLTNSWMLKLMHGLVGDMFKQKTLGLHWRADEGTDDIEGTYAAYLRWGSVHLRQTRTWSPVPVKPLEANFTGGLLEPGPQHPDRQEAAVLDKVKLSEDGTDKGPLAGRLIGIKDNICTTDLPTTCASGILSTFTSPYDATVVQRLRASGAIIAGKTNLDEFGMGSHSLNSHFGPVQQENGVSAGGSSGGSALAVATGQCWAALGTDTGGSVRLPAAYTDTVGFKPSYGLLSRWGVVAYANSLDTVGILASSVSAARIIFSALNAHDPQDPTSLTPSTRRNITALSSRQRSSPLRIGVPLEYNPTTLSPTIRASWLSALAHLQTHHSATLHPISLPTTPLALSAYYILAPAEASSNLAKYDGVRYGTRASGSDAADGVLFSKTRGQGFGEEVQRRILLGAYSLSSEAIENYFLQAQRVRRLVQRDFDRAFAAGNVLHSDDIGKEDADSEDEGVDVIVCPTAPSLPPKVAEVRRQSAVEGYLNDVFTVPASLAGLPACSVPWEVEEGKVTGIQVMGQFGNDELVFDVASLLEKST
ncbi:hypothetical protein LTS18_012739 [Coniosporium uncinatum]|uniref:Uncharacterized protein n=1 Tax=Coniosporium uncinatum TaxID=93489 RepID=A0ACC3D9B9_9PEZI|nr:hypothetical protein LTS18_012739 [Coniosporium uncinatum]